MSKKIVKVSKYLSFVLRHKPESINLRLDKQGWAKIDEVIEKSHEMELTKELIEAVVAGNDKQRFIIEGDKIRANQGHSIEVDLALEAVKPPDVLFHGTATRFLNSIMQGGLKKQQRQYVHLSANIGTARAVGKRHGKEVVLKVESKRMFEEGYLFYLSENGVWLTDVVPTAYLKE